MALHLHSTSAYEKSNSTIITSKLDSNCGARSVGAGIRIIGRCELRRRAKSGARPTIKKSAKLAGQEDETTCTGFVQSGNFGSQRPSRSTRLLDQYGGDWE